MKNFTNKYSLSKTLRFELIPQGKTLDHIENKGLIKQDEKLAESYNKMKKTIDGFHKHFIEIAMSQVQLTKLNEFAELYTRSSEEKKKDEKFDDKFKKVQESLRKEIVQGFNADKSKNIFSKIGKKELFTELLEDWRKEQSKDIYFDEKFKTFTTYFNGFHDNRKNMYSDKEQSTAIAYRLIHENLPKFIDNISIYKKAKNYGIDINNLEENLDSVLPGVVLDTVFTIDYFVNTLTQKDITSYNLVIGGYSTKDGKRIQGLNEIINLHNQRHDKNCIPKLKTLYKQILSDRESISFLPEFFKDDLNSTASQKVLNAIEEYYEANLINFRSKKDSESENILKKLKELLADINNYDLSKIYLRNDTKITNISQKIFGHYSVFEDALNFYYEKIENPKFNEEYQKSKSKEKLEKKKEKFIEQPYISISLLQKALEAYMESLDSNHKLKQKYISNSVVVDYFYTNFFAEQKEGHDKKFDFISNIEAKYSCIKGILNIDYPSDKKLHQEKTDISNIKVFLDSLMELLHFVKPLALPSDSSLEKDDNFYGHFRPWFEQLDLLIPLYNKVRNYAAQKPYNIEKFKLNFENSYFLSGWATEYSSKGGLIIIKDNNYYLAIVDKKLSDEDVIFLKENVTSNLAKRVIIDFQKPDNKNIPRLFIRSKGDNYAPAVTKYNLPIDEVIEIYDNGKFKTEYRKTNPKDYKSSLIKLIDYFKEGFTKHESYKHYSFSWKNSDKYQDISEFYKDVESSCYQLAYEEINFDNLSKLVDQGKIYLFQIYNKDFSKYSKGKPNIHTRYWKALFCEESLKNVIYKLNGQAEIFFRKKSIKQDKVVIHQANNPVKNKNPNAKKLESIFDYDIIKDKRYTVDKFQFHVPITLNFKASGDEYINQDVLSYLKNNPDINIIGIDRGERHLIYLSLIDQKGNILHQESLNDIIDKDRDVSTPYHKLLDKKENERAKAREDWGIIENIKELKEGYISQVVHKIAKMMVEYNAIVVMEDLNFGFKRGRFKVEKQIYQKLEKKLIDKLNYLVFKDKKPDEVGGIYNALQLTNKFESFQKLGKQSGFLFYVPAWNTSKIDPTTGFVNLFDTKYESVEKTREFFNKFSDIRFNSAKNYFEFEVDQYSKFNPKAEQTRKDWVICTYGDRILTFRNSAENNNWDNKELILTDEFISLFEKYGIDYKSDNLKNLIISQTNKSFFESLLRNFKLTLQMRNSKTNSDIDYLISPVQNNKGEFYDSRKADKTLPQNADANGAYHIAKKGLQWLEQINKFQGDNWKKLDLDKSNKGWLQFVQNKN